MLNVTISTEFQGTPPSQTLVARIEEMGLSHQMTTTFTIQPARNPLILASYWPPEPEERRLIVYVRARAHHPHRRRSVPNRARGSKYPFLAALCELAIRWGEGDNLLAGDHNTGRISEDESVKCFHHFEDRFMMAMAEAGWVDAYHTAYSQKRA